MASCGTFLARSEVRIQARRALLALVVRSVHELPIGTDFDRCDVLDDSFSTAHRWGDQGKSSVDRGRQHHYDGVLGIRQQVCEAGLYPF